MVIVPPKSDPCDGSVKLSSLFNQIGFNVKTSPNMLSDMERSRTLFCTYGWSDGIYSVTAKIVVTDSELNIIYTGIGEFGHSLNRTNDVANALEQAFKGIVVEYQGFSEEYAKKAPKSEQLFVDRKVLVEYFDNNLHDLNFIEGIWSDEHNRYNIGILRDTVSNNRDYVAIILNAESDIWNAGDVKIEFLETAYEGVYTTTYYLANKSKQGSTAKIDIDGFLRIPLRSPKTGSSIEAVYIKNYPKNIGTGSYSKTQPSKKRVSSSGSGFLLFRNGLVVTNYHVVMNARNIEVVFPEKNITKIADVILKDKNNDIAILKLHDFILSDITPQQIPFTFVTDKNVKVGQEVFTLGFPLGIILGSKSRLSTGRINSLYGPQDDPRLFQISNPLQPGNSGGPLFNSKSELVGIVVSGLNAKFFYEEAGIIPQNVNFAIKASYIKNLISMLPEGDSILNRINLVKQTTVKDQIEQVNPFIVQIRAY